MPPLPDFQSAFGHVTTNIVGCDWKSVQDYLASDLSDGMPDWWHRGGDIDAEYGNCISMSFEEQNSNFSSSFSWQKTIK